jgi:hypothetical protein
MFYSADPIRGSRKLSILPNQDDPAYWVVVPCEAQGWALHFEIARPDSDPLLRIIAALTDSQVGHVEWQDIEAPTDLMYRLAESKLGRPYDFEGALLAWKDTGYHVLRKEFCSGYAYEVLQPVLPGLQPYPNPGKLLSQVTGMLGLPMPKLAVPEAKLTDADFDYLDMLHAQGKVALGINQQVYQELQA